MSCPDAPPAPVLGLDASGPRASVAIRGFEHRLDRESADGERAGTVLHRLLKELLEEARLSPAELAVVAAVRGPGSFTGLRVALAAAQGLCLATGRPGVGVDTTAAVAWASAEQGELLVLLDGGQGRLFAGRHRRVEGRLESLGPVEDLSPPEALVAVETAAEASCLLRGRASNRDALLAAGARGWDGPIAGAAAELAAIGLAEAPLEPLYARAPAIRPRQP